MKCRSEWQSPATEVRIRTSRGPGFCRLTSSIASGLLTSCKTAAFIGVSPLYVYAFRTGYGLSRTITPHPDRKSDPTSPLGRGNTQHVTQFGFWVHTRA